MNIYNVDMYNLKPAEVQMQNFEYQTMEDKFSLRRRDFLKTGGIVGAGLVLGNPLVWAEEAEPEKQGEKPATNIDDAMSAPKGKYAIPGLFAGKVVRVCEDNVWSGQKADPEVVNSMFEKGLRELTGKSPEESFSLFFTTDDIVGIKVNPVGPAVISNRMELVDEVVNWLVANGIKKENIIIWDRISYMLENAGFTSERYPGIGIEALHIMIPSSEQGKNEKKWMDKNGRHISSDNFDPDYYYWADIEAPQDNEYLHQHVFNDKKSYFGKLVTQKLTKVINMSVFKNTGNGISMATKNLGYGAICNTGRLHDKLFFDICTEVLAFPAIRDKLVLNIVDGLKGQYEGGPMAAPEYLYDYNSIFFSTDPFAVDMIGHKLMVEKRKSMGIKVNEHPIFTEYLHYGQRLGLGIADTEQIEYIDI